jgi:alanine racemase
VCAIIKGDAYGIGGVQAALTAQKTASADCFGFCDNDEALNLRAHHIQLPLIRVRCASPFEILSVRHLNVEESIGSQDTIQALLPYLDAAHPLCIHIEVDIGMGRSGLPPNSASKDLIRALAHEPRVRIAGIYAHTPHTEQALIAPGLATFLNFTDDVLKDPTIVFPRDMVRHFANSACVSNGMATLDMIRVGQASYGFVPPTVIPHTKPLLSWHSRVLLLRHIPAGSTVGYGASHTFEHSGWLATLPLGFHHGYPRDILLRARACDTTPCVLIRGQRFPVVGVGSMNALTIDVTIRGQSETCVQVGDPVVLVGRQGDEEITIDEFSSWLGQVAPVTTHHIGRSNSGSIEWISS